MIVVWSADILQKIVIAFYFASSLSLAHFLHCWYVKKDPLYKGKIGLGFSFFHQDTISYKFGYKMTPVLFLLIFIVILATLCTMPALKTLSLDNLFWKYGVWILLELIAFYALCDVLNPSGSKLIQNALAIFIGFIILRSSTSDATLETVLTNWQFSWPIYAAPIGWGIYWVTAFQRDRMKRYSKEKIESPHELMLAYRVPVIYYFISTFWNILIGFGISVLSYFLSHSYQ